MPSRKVVLRLPNWVGDVVMATPTLISLRKGWPDNHITIMGKETSRSLLEGMDLWDHFIPFNRTGKDAGTGGFLKAASRLRKERFDTGIILPNSLSSALIFALGGVKRRIGYNRHGRKTLLTHPVPVKRVRGRFIPVPMVDYYLKLIEPLGIEPATRHVKLEILPEDVEWAEETWNVRGYNDEHPVIAVTPGAAYGPSKQWLPEYFAGVSDRLRKAIHAHVLFLPGPGEEALMANITRSCKVSPDILSPSETPLNRLKAVIDRCDLLLTNDTGPRHIAVALDTPVVVIMGPTDPRYTAANLEKTIVLRKNLSCSPCMLKVCPRDHECMRGIAPEEVFEACKKALVL
jgi:heptosyltransferase-2